MKAELTLLGHRLLLNTVSAGAGALIAAPLLDLTLVQAAGTAGIIALVGTIKRYADAKRAHLPKFTEFFAER